MPSKSSSKVSAHLKHDALRGPKEDVGATQGVHVADEGDAAVLDQAYVVSQVLYFPFQYRLQAEVAGGEEFVCFHLSLRLL